jgi:hypothetical protein
MVQKVQKQIPKYVLQAQEIIIDEPAVLSFERPVEVPQIMTAEAITQVPVAQVEIVEKGVPKVMTEAIETVQEVPQILIEEMLVEVPQVQVAEAIKQVPKEMLQARPRGIPKVSTQVREVVQAVSVPLINEVAVDMPQVQVVEVMKQTAGLSQQRLVQTSVQYEGLATQAYRTEAAVSEGVYQAQVIGTRQMGIQPTVVERTSPIMMAAPTYLETMVAPTTYGAVEYVETVAPTYGAVEYVDVAPTTMMGEYLVAPTVATEMLVAPTVYDVVEPVQVFM